MMQPTTQATHAATLPQASDTTGVDPATLLAYLMERRRAIITELRHIEAMLGMEQSIPVRRRPH